MPGSKKHKKHKTDGVKEHEETAISAPEIEIEREDADDIGQNITTEHITINRDEYLQSHRDLLNEIKHLQIRNNILHRRLAEYYRKRRLDHVLKPFQGTADLEEKFQQKLLSYEELKEKTEIEMANIRAKVSATENNIVGRLENAEKKFTALQNLERSTGTGLIYCGKGKPIADKTISRFMTLQASKHKQASALNLRYIRARNAVADLEELLRELETLGPGLYVCQYEQLNIDKQNFKNKIEEREDELIRHRAKCTVHNQILAHIREKMQHTEELIDFAECDLGESEIKFCHSREDLAEKKAKRNRLRWLLEAEFKKAGLLTKKDLLRDFQKSENEVVILQKRKEDLEIQIAATRRQLREARCNMHF